MLYEIVFVWDLEEGRRQISLRLALPSFLSQTLTTLVMYGLLHAMQATHDPPIPEIRSETSFLL